MVPLLTSCLFQTSVLRSKGYAEYKSVHGPKYEATFHALHFTISSGR